jgi:hypothetical protein
VTVDVSRESISAEDADSDVMSRFVTVALSKVADSIPERDLVLLLKPDNDVIELL